MEKQTTDIVVSGGGIAGLTAACVFGTAGFNVICVDPAPPVIGKNAAKSDQRTTAFLGPAIETLKSAGLWSRLEEFAAPLRIMRLIDAGGQDNTIRKIADFDAKDIGQNALGWNLPNGLLQREMLARFADLPNVTFKPGVATGTVTTRMSEALVNLTDTTQISCKLLIAADGRNSNIRAQMGIDCKTWRYGQKALAFTVRHPHPHENISTEIHRSGGPFTLVPLPDRDGQPHSSVVWMETGPKAARLQALPEPAFNTALNQRSCNILGELQLASPRGVFPIISQMATQLYAQRCALIAEAAHVIPPIGAQGLNMSLGDIQTLLDLAIKAPGDLGKTGMLSTYHKRRWPDVRARITGVDLLNRAAMSDSPTLQDLRLKGLETLHQFPPLRRAAMRAGQGF